MATVSIDLACSALPAPFRVTRARGVEAINALSRWEIGILSPEADIDFASLIGAPAAVKIIDEAEGTSRLVGLVLAEIAHDEESRDGHHYTVVLAPPEHLLDLRSGYAIFQSKTAKEIVTAVLAEAGIPANQAVWRLSGTYSQRVHCARYDETEWAFIERMLADEGISYWFDADAEGKPQLVLGDSPSAHDGLEGGRALPYDDQGGAIAKRRLFELERDEVMVPNAVHVRDYDVRAPNVLIEGKAGKGSLEHYEYPACVPTSDAAVTRAQVRLDQLRRLKVHARAASDCIRLAPGRVVTIEGCADEWMNGDYLVIRAEQELVTGTRTAGESRNYVNRVSLVPHGDTAFRPEIPSAVPRVEGIESAFTTGPSGEEIHVDDLGRLKVRFPWDRSGITDDKSSYWVRSLQMNMAGSMALPRVGWEVPIAYQDGNPDRPFILGRIYNAVSVVPYGLPGAAATTTFQSATAPGGGSTNELRMGDGAGKQEMYIHASKDQTVVVGGSATSDVGSNETHDIKLTLTATVNASQSLTVGASQSVNVGTDYAISVKGSRSEMIGGMETIKVTANRRVSTGSYSELIGALYGIQCNQSNTSVNASFTQLVGGSLSLNGGLGVSETVVAARAELVGGSKSLVSAGAVSESVMGAKILSAGSARETAGGKLGTSVKAAGKISVGGSAKLKSSGEFVIEGKVITIEAASLSAGALALEGGALKAKDGTTDVKAPTIKRKDGAKLG
jgi:type VI secretion system secreted protein VgrG